VAPNNTKLGIYFFCKHVYTLPIPDDICNVIIVVVNILVALYTYYVELNLNPKKNISFNFYN